VYVDITTAPVWDGDTLRAVDLDLDVIRGSSGRVWVDDEDEFADHRVRFGYPDEVVRLAITSCDEVLAALGSRLPPYDGVVGAAWIDRLDAAMMDR
jgi:protein associated with RNAse G/E